jgi:hypothetical protein
LGITAAEQFVCQSLQRLELKIGDMGARTLRESVAEERVMALSAGTGGTASRINSRLRRMASYLSPFILMVRRSIRALYLRTFFGKAQHVVAIQPSLATVTNQRCLGSRSTNPETMATRPEPTAMHVER